MGIDDLPEEIKKQIRDAMEKDPTLADRYGNPFDKNDPRFWKPTDRTDLSLEDQVKYLANDVEAISRTLSMTMEKVAELNTVVADMEGRELQRRIQEVKDDPAKAVALMEEIVEKIKGGLDKQHTDKFYGPEGENGPAYAGSTQGIPPDAQVSTPNGYIRADQIPGYRNDPEWRPSPDWVEANCTCPAHVRDREAAAESNPFGIDPFKDDGDDGHHTGMYL